jgi:hypothetical protein
MRAVLPGGKTLMQENKPSVKGFYFDLDYVIQLNY